MLEVDHRGGYFIVSHAAVTIDIDLHTGGCQIRGVMEEVLHRGNLVVSHSTVEIAVGSTLAHAGPALDYARFAAIKALASVSFRVMRPFCGEPEGRWLRKARSEMNPRLSQPTSRSAPAHTILLDLPPGLRDDDERVRAMWRRSVSAIKAGREPVAHAPVV